VSAYVISHPAFRRIAPPNAPIVNVEAFDKPVQVP
jgi:hypothetical protein